MLFAQVLALHDNGANLLTDAKPCKNPIVLFLYNLGRHKPDPPCASSRPLRGGRSCRRRGARCRRREARRADRDRAARRDRQGSSGRALVQGATSTPRRRHPR